MAEKVKLQVEVDNSQGKKAMGEMSDATADANEGVGELSGGLNAMTGGAVAGFTAMKSGLSKVVMGMKTLKGAIAATGIGLLLVAFASLNAFFTKTERGAQALRVITAALEAAMGSISDVVVGLGEAIFNAFNNPKKALEDFQTSLKKYVIDNVNKILDGFGLLGQAIKKVFKGDFDGAMESAKEGALALGEAVLKLNPATGVLLKMADAAGKLADEIEKDVKAATSLEQRMNAVKLAERALNVERAESLKIIAKARLAAEDETTSAEQKIVAIKKASSIEAEITKKEIANERERLAILEAQAELNESDEATLDAIAQQKIRVSQIELQSFNLTRKLTLELNTLDNEIHAARLAKEKEIRNLDKPIIGSNKDLQKIIAEREIQLVQDTEERKLAIRNDMGEKYVAGQEGFAKRSIVITQDEVKQTLTATAGILGSLTQLNANQEAQTETQRKIQFKRGQKLAVAQALISTYQSAVSAFSAVVGLGPAGPILAPIAAAAATAAGLARVNQIKKQKYTGGATAGSASSGSSNIPTAPTQTNAARGIDIDTDNVGADTGNITKTYVLSKDVSNKQELDAAIKRESVI